jgi:hypothetical protein
VVRRVARRAGRTKPVRAAHAAARVHRRRPRRRGPAPGRAGSGLARGSAHDCAL